LQHFPRPAMKVFIVHAHAEIELLPAALLRPACNGH
jgi:hypothetical protein